MNRKVLLVEPNYKNKYPPMGLMKLATYYRESGDDVRFFKGDLLDLAADIGGFVAGTYWLLMLVGRLCSSFIANKVSSRSMMIVANGAGMLFILLAVLLGKSTTVDMPVFTGSSFQLVTVPISAMFLVLCGLCTSIIWPSIFNLATEGLGKYTAQASGIFMMMVVGGDLMPLRTSIHCPM